jgi:hypothetical protein
MCSLGAGDQSDRRRLSWCSRFSEFDIDTLGAKEFHHLSPMKTPLPISPDNGMRSWRWRRERRDLLGFVTCPEHCTHAARSFRGRPIPLAFLTPRTGTAVADAGSIDHPHAAISSGATSLRIERETGRRLRGAVRLGSEVFARETSIRETAHTGGL